jgi:ankyrin repeat protein
MNIEKADYGLVIQFGTVHDFYTKLQMEGKTLHDVIDYTDQNGVSLLEKSLSSRKFDIAKLLLDNGAKVNIVSKEGYNEFHYIAGNIRYEGGLEIAKILLDRGVSLVAKDKKYGNTALFTLCMEIFKVRSVEALEFLETCFERCQEYDICNKAGYSVRMLINERGTDNLKRIMEGKT